MPEAYSRDLRGRVARFVEGGRSCHAAAALFSVSVSFVVRLMNRHSPDKCRLKTTLRLFVVIGKPGSPRTRLRRV